jgi:hypothetical protein
MPAGRLWPTVAFGFLVMSAGHSAQGATGSPEIEARDEYIIGRPQRLAPLKKSEMSEASRDEAEAFRKSTSGMTANPVAPGDIPPMVATMIRHPALWRQHTALAKQLMLNGSLPNRDRELAVLCVGWLWKAPVEWGEHVSIGKKAGLSAEEIERVTHGSDAPGWNAHDRTVVRAVEELHSNAMISDQTWAELAKTYDDKQLIELPMLVGQYVTVAYYQNSLRLAPRAGNGGLTSR